MLRPAARRPTLGRLRALAAARARVWRETRLLRPILTVAGGTAAAQALVFAARPVLTRLYGPEAWGTLTLFVTLVSVLSAVASGGYRFAILLPAREGEAAAVARLALGCGVFTALLSALGVGVLRALGLVLPLWALLPLALLALEVSLTAETWLTRRDRFRVVSLARLGQGATTAGLQLLAGLGAASAAGLVGGAAGGFGVAALVMALAVGRTQGARLGHLFHAEGLGRLARRYARFPLYSAPAALLNLIGTRAPVFLLAAFASAADVGQFGVAYGSLALPVGLVTGAVGQVFFVRAAEAHRAGTLPTLTRRVLRGLVGVTAFPCGAVLVAGPALFAFVFGPEWETAGVYAQVLAPWVLLASVAAPLTSLFDVLERQRADFGFSVLMAGGMALALGLAGPNASAFGLVVVASAAGAGLRLLHLGWMLRLARVPLGGALRETLAPLGLASLLSLGLWAMAAAGAGGLSLLIATLAGSAASAFLAGRDLEAAD